MPQIYAYYVVLLELIFFLKNESRTKHFSKNETKPIQIGQKSNQNEDHYRFIATPEFAGHSGEGNQQNFGKKLFVTNPLGVLFTKSNRDML